MIEEWIKKQKEILAAATPGPWVEKRWNDAGLIQELNDSTGWKKDYPGSYIASIGGWGYVRHKNSQFIASVRTDHEIALKLIENYREALEFYENMDNRVPGTSTYTDKDNVDLGFTIIAFDKMSKIEEDVGIKARKALEYFPDK